MTLAFYGKSRRHRGVLALLVLMTLLAAIAAGAFSQRPTEAAGSVNVDLDQWANGTTTTAAGWQNGNLNGNNSTYAEGLVVPFRLAVEGLDPTKQYSITIQYDFTAGGHKAYDYLTTYNATEAATPCSAGGGGVSSLCPALPLPDTAAFPDDLFTADGLEVPDTSGMLTAHGAVIDSIGTVVHSGSTNANSTGSVLVTFTPSGTATLFLWGGHLAESSYWNSPADPDGAGQVSGAPWHMRTLNLTNVTDGVSGGAANQDRSIQPSALGTTAGSLEVSKVVDWDGATPDTNQTFQICITGPSYPLGTETGACQTAPSGGGVLTWADILTGDYTIAETSPGTQWEVTYSTQNVTVAENQTATATVTNRLLSATIKIRKFVDNVLTAGWDYNASATSGSLPGGASYTTGVDGTVTFYVNPSGTASVDLDEVLKAGYNFLDAVCYYAAETAPGSDLGVLAAATQTVSGISVIDGDAIVCDFYNQLQVAGDLNVTKTATGLFDYDVDWTITKVGVPDVHNLPDDGAGSTVYDIDVTRIDTPTNYRVEGTVTVMNPGGNTENAIVASIVDANAVFSNCTPLGGSTADYSTAGQVTFSPALVLAPGASVTCDYDITGLLDDSLTTNEANATVTQDSLVQPPAQNGSAAVSYAFSGTYTGEPTSINVTDIGDASGTQNFGPFTTTSSFGYTQEFTCATAQYDANGQATLTFNNRADIDETTDFAEETVTVNCQQPQLTLLKTVTGEPDKDALFTLTIAGEASGPEPVSAYVPSGSVQNISESSVPGYSFVSLVCVDENTGAVAATNAALGTVTMPAGGLDVTCAYTNEFDPASISVRKTVDLGNTVIPAGHPLLSQTFQICIQGTTAGASYPAGDCKTVGHNGVATWDDLLPGSYTISETDPGPNWTVTGDDGASVTVATGETATERAITNTFRPGGLTVAKAVVLDGAQLPAGSEFQICIQGPSYPAGNEAGACQTLNDAGSLGWSNLIPGDYTVSEPVALPSDYWTTNITGSPVTVAPGSTGSPTDAADATVTNTLKKASIDVTKTIDWDGYVPAPDEDPQFEICITGPSYASTATPGACQTIGGGDTASWTNLIPGTYTVHEPGAGSQWQVTINGDIPGDPDVELEPGEQGSATVINKLLRGSLTVTKTINWNGPVNGTTFEICITGPSYPLGKDSSTDACHVFTTSGEQYTWNNLIKGSYTVNETGPGPNWAVSGSGISVTVPAGGSNQHTVSNTRVTGDLTVTKTVDWNGAPADPAQTFQVCITGPSYPSGDCKTVSEADGWSASWNGLQTGNYTVQENFPDGDSAEWDTTVDDVPGTSGEVGVVSGEPASVAITNTLKGVTLTINKVYEGAAPDAPQILIDGNAVTGGPNAWGPFDGSTTPAISPNTNVEVVEVLPPGWLNTDVTFNDQCGTSPQAYKLTTIAGLIDNSFSGLLGLSVDEDAAGARVNIPPDSSCTVTFTNTWSPAKIVVNKTVEWGDTVNHPANPTFEICLFDPGDLINAIACGTTDGTTTVEFDGLLPGNYVVAETSPGSSWSTTVNSIAGLSAQVALIEGETENVAVANTFQPGALAVRKTTILNGTDLPLAQTFEICIAGPSYPNGNEVGACKTWNAADILANMAKAWNNLLPGDYTVTETDPGSEWHVAISGSPVTVNPGDTADVNNPDATVTNTRIIPLEAEKTGAGTYGKAWTVDKITTTPTINLPDDGTGQANYEVTITSSVVNVQASGNITVTNPAGNPVDAIVSGITDIGATVVCPESFPVTLQPGESLACTYTMNALDAGDIEGVQNTATANVSESSDVPGDSDTITINFASTGPDSVDLEDVFDGGAPVSEGTGLTDGVVKYSRDVTCAGIENWSSETGQGSKTVLNTATIYDGDADLDSDDASVQVNCQRPKLTLVKVVSDAFTPATEPLALPADFNLAIEGNGNDDGTHSAYVSSGQSYGISESSTLLDSDGGYVFTGVVCEPDDEGAAVTYDGDAPGFSVDMPASLEGTVRDVTCTFTNEFDPGKITVTKVVDFSGAEFKPDALFTICLFEDGADTTDETEAIDCQDVTGDPAGTPDDTAEFDNLLPGTYIVVEFYPNGDQSDWEVAVYNPGDEVTLVTTGADASVTVTNTLKEGEIIVRKIYVGATATNADAPVVTVDGETPAHQGVVSNESEWDAVAVAPYTPAGVSEDLKPGWKNVDISYDGCWSPQIIESIDQVISLLALVVGDTPATSADTLAAVAPGGTCIVTFTNEAYGTVVVEKIDQSANENEWDFEVNGPNQFSDTPHITGSDSVTYLDMPLGSYNAAETTAGILSSVEQCQFPNPNGEGTYVTAATPTTQSLSQPGQTITFQFLNQDCPVVLGSGSLVIEKWSDLDADGVRDAGEPGVAGWKFTVAGPEFPAGQDFFTNSNGLVLGLDGITAGFYTVTEGTQGGWAQTALYVTQNNVRTQLPVSTTAVVEVKAGNSPSDWPLVEVEFGNRPPATVRVVKTVVDQVGNRDRSGWHFNLAGCGTSINGVTDANGEITWSNLQPAINCAYTVTETDTEGFSVSPSQAQVVSPGPGDTATVTFTNSRIPGETPIPTPTNTPTATPTSTPTETPTNTPEPTETVAGEKTPGPGSIATPIPPDTGSGFAGAGTAANLMMALLGILAISGGLAIFSLGRKRA